MIVRKYAALLVCGMSLLGCSEQPKPAEVPVSMAPELENANSKSAGSSSKKSEPYDVTVAGFRYTVPADWEEQPPKSQFVLGEFAIPGEGGTARLTLSSAGGGIEANVERWRGQFKPGPNDPAPQESEITFDGKPGTLVELAGSYTDMFGGGAPSNNWQMLGVAVPMGPTNYFIKLTGPASTVTPRRDEFLKFVESARMPD
jgi:hypothetical protein